ncbi:MAG TPA: DUF1064 domain-containing protein [Paenibacillus sp.]|nr:DUF1064 domain-containing protein [Paenibacillus sp.]HZG83857.1 DUF1064 domain-containing protein [Paenibacillus sp.]
MFEVDMLRRHGINDVTGIKFDSKMEAEYYLLLKKRMAAGEIQDIVLQPEFILQDKPRIKYKADFQVVYPGGDFEVIDVKGHITKDFRLKQKLFAAVYEDYKLTLVTKRSGRWMER